MPDPFKSRPCSRRSLDVSVLVTLAATVIPFGVVVGQPGQAPPAFRTRTDLVTIDLQIAAVPKATLREFALSDFSIEISRRKRTPVSATMLHYDEGSVIRDLLRAPGSGPSCVFGFHRKKDLRTVHYLLGVEATEGDRREVKQVEVALVDRVFEIQSVVWRTPVRRADRRPDTPLQPTSGAKIGVE